MSAAFVQMIEVLPAAAAWLAAGLAIGALHFATLHRNAAALAAGGSLAMPLLLHAGRLALTGGLLFAVVQLGGALPLLLATAGILIARTVAVRGERPA